MRRGNELIYVFDAETAREYLGEVRPQAQGPTSVADVPAPGEQPDALVVVAREILSLAAEVTAVLQENTVAQGFACRRQAGLGLGRTSSGPCARWMRRPPS